jgi:drug/metabolite transporter (DMT)-like permease
VAFAVLCLCWSTTWQAIRYCLDGYPPMSGAGLRFLLATALIFLLLRLRRGQLVLPGGARQHLAIAAAGIVNGLGYGCIYVAERTLSGGTTAVICAASPLFTLVLARLMGLEVLSARRLLGMLFGMGGVVALFLDGLTVGIGQFVAMLLAGLAAAFFWPIYSALLKRHAQHVPPLVATTYFLLYTAATLCVMSLGLREPLPAFRTAPWTAHAALLYLSIIGSVVAWSIYLWLLQRLDLTVLATLGLIQPVLALVLDLLTDSAQLKTSGYLGTLLVLAGMGLAAWPVRRTPSDPPPASPGAPAGAPIKPLPPAPSGPVPSGTP